MKCLDVRPKLLNLYDGELVATEAVRQGMEGHLSSCSTCRAEWEEWQRVAEWMKEVPEVPPPPGLREAILTAVATVEQPARLSCAQALEVLHHYVDGELPEARREQVDAHRAACVDCDRAFVEMESYQDLFQSIREVAPPADLRQAIYMEIHQLQPSFWDRLRVWLNPPIPVVRWAALPAAAIIIGLVLLPLLSLGPGKSTPPPGERLIALNQGNVSDAPMLAATTPMETPLAVTPGEKLSPAPNVSPPPVSPPAVEPAPNVRPAKVPGNKPPRTLQPRNQPVRMAVQPRPLREPPKPPAQPPAMVASAPPMNFSVPWPASEKPAVKPETKLADATAAPAPPEPSEPLALNYRRIFGAITNTGKAMGSQPEDLGSSTGPSPAASPPSPREAQGNESEPTPATGSETGPVKPTTEPVSLPAGGASAGMEKANDETTIEGHTLPDLGMGE